LTGYPISRLEAAFVLAIIIAIIFLYAFLSSKKGKRKRDRAITQVVDAYVEDELVV